LMEGWKTRLEVTDRGEARISRWFLQMVDETSGKGSYKLTVIRQWVFA
jgi:hypothetical protein